jgi:hypothetical protein
MASVLKQAVAGAMRAQNAFAGETVTYSRGLSPSSSVVLTAIPTLHEYTIDEGQAVLTVFESHDWLIDVAALVIDGTAAEPAAGDQVVLGGLTYQVVAPGGMAAYGLEADGRRYRVHSQRITPPPPPAEDPDDEEPETDPNQPPPAEEP